MDILFIRKTIGCWSILSWKRNGVYYHWIYITIYYPCWIYLDMFDIFWQSPTLKNRTVGQKFKQLFCWTWSHRMKHRSFTSCFTNREIQTKLHKTAPALHLKATVYTRLTLPSLLVPICWSENFDVKPQLFLGSQKKTKKKQQSSTIKRWCPPFLEWTSNCCW